MNVVNVQAMLLVQINVYAQTTALFLALHADVVIDRVVDWPTAKHDIAIRGLAQLAIFAQPVIHAQFARDEMRLIVVAFFTG